MGCTAGGREASNIILVGHPLCVFHFCFQQFGLACCFLMLAVEYNPGVGDAEIGNIYDFYHSYVRLLKVVSHCLSN